MRTQTQGCQPFSRHDPQEKEKSQNIRVKYYNNIIYTETVIDFWIEIDNDFTIIQYFNDTNNLLENFYPTMQLSYKSNFNARE